GTQGGYRRGEDEPGRRAGPRPAGATDGAQPGPRAGRQRSGGGVVAVDEADRIDAVALIGGRGEALALEDVTEVRAAPGAAHLDASHPQRGVLEQLDGVGIGRGIEGGPAAAGVELGGGREQLRAAALAGVGAGRTHLLVLPGAGTLGRPFAQDLELGGGEP